MLVAYCRLCRHCRNLAEGGCLLSRFHFTCSRYFLGHVTCQNLPWQGLQKSGMIMLAEIQDLMLVQVIIYHWVVMLSLLILSSSSFLSILYWNYE